MNTVPDSYIEIYTEIFRAVHVMASDGHASQKRRNGVPYMSHIDSVVDGVTEITAFLPWMSVYEAILVQAVAAGHDLYEDHPDRYPLIRIRAGILTAINPLMEPLSGPERAKIMADVEMVVAAIAAISKKPKGTEEYAQYVQRVASNLYAMIVKISDLKHNMSDLEHGSMRDKYSLTLHVLREELSRINIRQSINVDL